MKVYIRLMVLAVAAMTLTFCVSVGNNHPAYLHALEDLRAARSLIDRPAHWVRTLDENEAMRQIDGAIREIKYAAIQDNKNTEWHPAVDVQPDRVGRFHEALDFLNKARSDVNQDEDNYFANGLRDRTLGHIDDAIHATLRALSD
jgi:tetratricopeptide (TPR) repeat protein